MFLGDLNIDSSDFKEDGETFSENAYKKAKFFRDKTGLLTLGEDSGIHIDALDGELGVTTRRWGAGEDASDEEWIKHFMERMKGEVDRGAEFVCSACLLGEGVEEYFQEETKGRISEELLAPLKVGIPLSSCFVPEGFDRAYAALTVVEKNEISHRGKAMQKVLKFLTDM